MHWFLPQSADVLGMLREQAAITVEGMDELVAWARGEDAAAERLRHCEHRADKSKRELREALTDGLLDAARAGGHLRALARHRRNPQRRQEHRRRGGGDARPRPTRRSPRWRLSSPTARGSWHRRWQLLEADDRAAATDAADRAVKDQRHLQHTYRAAMSALVEVEDQRELAARRELYRRLARAGDELVAVAERVWYSVLKES